MKHLALATILTVGSALVLGSATTVHAQGNGNNAGLEIPVTGTGPAADLTGTFTLQRFITTAEGVSAVGRLVGTVTDTATGLSRSLVRNVVLPVTV